MKVFTSFWVLFISISIQANAQTIDLKNLIAQHAEAIHLPQWKALENYTMVMESPLDSGISQITSTMKKENKQFRLDFLTPQNIAVKAFNGKKGWIMVNGKDKKMSDGEVLKVICTDPGTMADIPTWSRINGIEVLGYSEVDKYTVEFLLRK